MIKHTTILFVAILASAVEGFVTISTIITRASVYGLSTSLHMGLFDAIGKALSNEEFTAPLKGVKATARHILVTTWDDVDTVTEKLKSGAPFASVAKEFSTCPSGSQGGWPLGSFPPEWLQSLTRSSFLPRQILGRSLDADDSCAVPEHRRKTSTASFLCR